MIKEKKREKVANFILSTNKILTINDLYFTIKKTQQKCVEHDLFLRK